MLQIHRHSNESLVIINESTGEEVWIAVGDIQGPRGNRAARVSICLNAPKGYKISRKELHEASLGISNPSPLHDWSVKR